MIFLDSDYDEYENEEFERVDEDLVDEADDNYFTQSHDRRVDNLSYSILTL